MLPRKVPKQTQLFKHAYPLACTNVLNQRQTNKRLVKNACQNARLNVQLPRHNSWLEHQRCPNEKYIKKRSDLFMQSRIPWNIQRIVTTHYISHNYWPRTAITLLNWAILPFLYLKFFALDWLMWHRKYRIEKVSMAAGLRMWQSAPKS